MTKKEKAATSKAWAEAADMVDFKVKEGMMCGPMPVSELVALRNEMLENAAKAWNGVK